MITAQPLREKAFQYCQHNKIPKVIIKNQRPYDAIRLLDMSKLKKLGSRDNRICRDCNERVCRCVWSKRDTKQRYKLAVEQKNSSATTSHHKLNKVDVIKTWNYRYTILDKFRENRNKFHSNNRTIASRNSAIWIVRPNKSMYASETNLLDTLKSSESDPSSKANSPQNLSNISMKSETNDWRLELKKTIAKDTKEYFNQRRKRLFEVINQEDQKNKKLIEEEILKRYQELDKLSIHNMPQTVTPKTTAINLLENTKLRLVRGAEIMAAKGGEEANDIKPPQVEHSEKTAELENVEKPLQNIDEGLKILNSPLEVHTNTESNSIVEQSTPVEINNVVLKTPRKTKKHASKKKTVIESDNLSKATIKEEKLSDETISDKKSKTTTKRMRRHRKLKKGKKTKKQASCKKVLSSTSLVLEENQIGFSPLEIEETLSSDDDKQMLFDPTELSVTVNEICLDDNELLPDNDDESPSMPVITVANGALKIRFHKPINNKLICKRCGF